LRGLVGGAAWQHPEEGGGFTPPQGPEFEHSQQLYSLLDTGS
jgi:hypothetical protein